MKIIGITIGISNINELEFEDTATIYQVKCRNCIEQDECSRNISNLRYTLDPTELDMAVPCSMLKEVADTLVDLSQSDAVENMVIYTGADSDSSDILNLQLGSKGNLYFNAVVDPLQENEKKTKAGIKKAEKSIEEIMKQKNLHPLKIENLRG